MAAQEIQTNTTADQTGPVGLTLQDLVLVAQIIQVNSQRGAFRAEELTAVGNLYTKLIAFLQQSGALAPATPEESKND